jgi:hypothetical protein
MTNSNSIDNLVIFRRLMFQTQFQELLRKGKKEDADKLKKKYQEDEALISGEQSTGEVKAEGPSTTISADLKINLSELYARLKQVQSPKQDATQQITINYNQTVQQKMSLSYSVLDDVSGLVKRSNSTAETDRYRFEFQDGTSFKITDKWSNLSTTVWGDPHVDVSDVEGENDGDFKDMSASNSYTTFMLQDNTRLTFTAEDDGVIKSIDIFKGNQHLQGIGQGNDNWNEGNQFFTAPVSSGSDKQGSVPKGDTVYAGGDGNDWYTSDGQLLWGEKTAKAVNSKPYAVLQYEYSKTISQELTVQATAVQDSQES